MSNNNLFRIGGIAAIASIVLLVFAFAAGGGSTSISDVSFLMRLLLSAFAIAVAVFVFSLYRLYRAEEPTMSLVGAIGGIGGAVLLVISVLILNLQSLTLYGIAMFATLFLPALLFGFLAYQHSQIGFSRILGAIGIVAGVFGLINTVLVVMGGGDWNKPNDPALYPLIMGSYSIASLAAAVWLVWGGIVLLRRKA